MESNQDKFKKLFMSLVKEHEITMEVTYSKFIGWNVRVFEKGYDRPFVDIDSYDMEDAFDRAYIALYSNYN